MEIVYTNLIREYFELEYKTHFTDNFDVHRVIDDFVIFSFFIGNDFLSRLFCMNTKQGVFDNFIKIIQEFYQTNQDYLTCNNKINWKNWTSLLKKLLPLQNRMIEITINDFSRKISDMESHHYFKELSERQKIIL